MIASPGDHHAEAKLGEHREPEGVVLVHAQNTGNADVSAERLGFGEASVSEDPLVLPVIEVGKVRLAGNLFEACPALATVPRHMPFSIGEGRDCHLAVVLTQAAGLARGLDLEVLEVFHASECRLTFATVVHAGRERCAVSSHESGNIGANNLAAGEQLECAKHRVIEESPSLDDDAFAQIRGILELDDLVQGITHDGVGQAGADVAHVRAFFLRLFDRGIHEDRAARPQIHGIR